MMKKRSLDLNSRGRFFKKRMLNQKLVTTYQHSRNTYKNHQSWSHHNREN
jgi:hypothetical protein